jgi:hypothetical protein
LKILFRVISSEYPSPVKQNIRGVNLEKFLGIFPRTCQNFPMNMSENFLGIFAKLIPWNIHIPKEKFQVIFAMDILLGTNAKYTWNFSYGIIPTF